MDNNINDIDKFFKDRLDGQESPYVPGAWENMEAMLDADNSGMALKNINRFILASVAGAIILAGSVVAYISGYESPAQVAQKTTTEKEVIVENDNTTSNTAQNEAGIVDAPTTNNTAENTTANDDVNNTPAPSAPKAAAAPKVPTATATTPTKELPNANDLLATGTDKKDIVVDEPKVEETVETSTTKLFDKETYSTTLLSQLIPTVDTRFKGFPDINDFVTNQKLLIDSAQRAQRRIDEMERFYRPQFGIQAGGNFNRVLSNTSDNFEVGSGLMAGFFFSKNLTKKWGVSAELNYLRTTGNNITRTITQTEYFLEKTTTNFFIVTKSFDYLQVPLAVSFAPTARHKFSLGATSLFMLNAKSEVAENKEKITEKSSVTTTENGVYEDLNTFNYGVLLGYEYNLPGKYSIGLRYNQMFNDVTANSFFNDNKKHLPAHLQLFVKLNLTR